MLVKDYFTNISINELKRKLNELDKIDLKNSSFEDVFKKVIETFSGIVLCRVALSFGEETGDPRFGLFRARQVDGTFDLDNPDNYWAKPAQFQVDYGRCHSITESRFYASNYILSTVLECRAKPGSEWVIAEFDIIENTFFESVFLGGVGTGFDRMMGHQGRLDFFFSNLSKSEKKKNNLLYKYISKKLGEKVSSSKKYKLTAAISKFFFRSPHNSANVECIIYPSLMTKKKVLNFAIDSESAREKLRIIRIYHVRVESISTKESSNLHIVKKLEL
ncbi:hypothetical protein [Bacteriovorax sp. BSW11_IV]|uniref:hypothetical protein n=1 Tax=Bacteriovorax sp. BSW11_IV TaxID=1353529 RepID=UPI0003FE65A1|nr:hypothetical protein [Bacteriovorax sp. BSW11_IV]